MRLLRCCFLLLATLLLAAGCDSSGPETEEPPPPGNATYDVTYTPQSVVLEGAAADALVETRGSRYTFDAEALQDEGVTLEAGRVLLVAGTALRRITGVSQTGDRLVAETTHATLDELIQDGTLGWEETIDFTDFERATLQVAGDPAALWSEGQTCTPQVQGTTVTFECEINDYDLTFEVSAQGEGASVRYQVVKKTGENATATFSGEGTLRPFTHQADVEYSGGRLTNLDYQTNDLQVDLQIELAAAGSGSSDLDYALPVAALKIPFTIGPIPAFIGIGVQVVASLDVPLQAQASATASAEYSYNGASGLTYKGTDVNAAASAGGIDFSNGSFDSASRFAPVDAQFGIAFPRVSLGLFATELAHVQTGFTVGSRITFGPICKSGYSRLLVDAGYDISFMGIELANGDTTLVDRDRRASQDDCAENTAATAALF